jgi:hypothetical protein
MSRWPALLYGSPLAGPHEDMSIDGKRTKFHMLHLPGFNAANVVIFHHMYLT